MSPHPPTIFISATSADLGTCRLSVKNALHTLGCLPDEQATFPPDGRKVLEKLRARIASCHEMVHIAGEVYGTEPRNPLPGEPRCSYTQLEYKIARELGKPVHVFVCGEGFPYDPHQPEDYERQRLQREHRERLVSGDFGFEWVGTRDELDKRVLALQTRIEELKKELARTRSWLKHGVVVGLVLAVVMGGAVLWQGQRTTQSEQRIGQVETDLDRQRRYITFIANAYGEQQRQLDELKLTDEQLFDRAVATVAEREGVDAGELWAGIDLFVAAVRRAPDADYLDRALADFAERRFASASQNAEQAVREARRRSSR